MIAWTDGTWTTPPAESTASESTASESAASGSHLDVTAREGSDAWRHTAYGFVHENAHALLAPLAVGEAMDVSFRAPWEGQFDQAGLYVQADEEHWMKAGLEFADGHLGLGAVVTDIRSDWSVGHVDDWHGSEITVRVSRWTDALIVRARAGDGEWRLVRVAPFDGDAVASAGPFLAAPMSANLVVTFTRWERSAADEALH